MAPRTRQSWAFRRRLRPNAFGWRNTAAIAAVKDAIRELRAVARKEPARAAAGAVELLERIPAACAHTDDSSGALQRQICAVIDLLEQWFGRAGLPDDEHEALLERLWQSWLEDDMSWLDELSDRWGPFCVSPERASRWADRVAAGRSEVEDPGDHLETWKRSGRFELPYLSLLHAAGRHEEVIRRVTPESWWLSRRWAIRSLRALGRRAEALRLIRVDAAGARPQEAERMAEEILLDSGLREQAWADHALAAAEDVNRVLWLKRLLERYPERTPTEVLERLVAATPTREGRWFAAARQAGLLDEALALARVSPAEPATLQTAVFRHADSEPAFAFEAGLLAIRGLANGDAFDPEKIEFEDLCDALLAIARREGRVPELRERVAAQFRQPGRERDYWALRIRARILDALGEDV